MRQEAISKITSISCIVSNNIIKDDYTTLANEQNIELGKCLYDLYDQNSRAIV